jgi:hypothetical protein
MYHVSLQFGNEKGGKNNCCEKKEHSGRLRARHLLGEKEADKQKGKRLLFFIPT